MERREVEVKKGANTVDVSGLETGSTRVFLLDGSNYAPLFHFVSFE